MIVFEGERHFNKDFTNFTFALKNNITIHQLRDLTNYIISVKYNNNGYNPRFKNPQYILSIFSRDYVGNPIYDPAKLIGFVLNDNVLYINININKDTTFPLQIINKYDYLTMVYKKNKHRKFIRRWKEALYIPNSKYYHKIKNNFEQFALKD